MTHSYVPMNVYKVGIFGCFYYFKHSSAALKQKDLNETAFFAPSLLPEDVVL